MTFNDGSMLSMIDIEYVSLQGKECIYYRGGLDPNETPIILLHGLSQQSRYWERVMTVVPRSVLALDLRGHGLSQEFTEFSDLSVDRVARDVIELMDALEIPKAHIVGHSWGASVALRICAIAWERTLSCVLLDGGVFNPTDLIPHYVGSTEELRHLLTPPAGPFSWQMLVNHYHEIDPLHSDRVMSAVSDSYCEQKPDEYLTKIGLARHMRILDELISYDHASDTELTRVPTWVILCLDGDYWDVAKSAVRPFLVNNAHIHVQNWYGCHHDVPLQRPTAVAELIVTVASMTDD